MGTFDTANKTEKVSDRIIEQIRDAALKGRLQPGDRLGSEKELTLQFGVSKATMREAMRVLEAMGLVEIRKGIQGGVFLAEVDMETTIHGIINFLHFKSVSIREITMLRYILEPAVAKIAATRITPGEIAHLRNLIESESRGLRAEVAKDVAFHRFLARITANPMLVLIMDFIDAMISDIKRGLDLGPDFFEMVRVAHLRILECLARGDGEGARREIIADLMGVGNHIAGLVGSEAFDPAELGGLQGGSSGNGSGVDGFRDDDEAVGERSQIMNTLSSLNLLSGQSVFRHEQTGEKFMLVPMGKEEAE